MLNAIFAPYGDSQIISVTQTDQRITLPALPSGFPALRLSSLSADVGSIWTKLGDSSVAGSLTSSMRMMPGSAGDPAYIGVSNSETHLAIFADKAGDILLTPGRVIGPSTGLSGPVTVNPGSDTDATIFTVGVTGSPNVKWDESSDAFSSNKPWVISSDGNGDVTHTIAGANVTSDLEVHSVGASDLGGISIHRHTDANNFGGHLLFLRSDGTHVAPTLVDDGDTLGRMIGLGYDGVDYELAAEIRFVVDGTAAEDQMPGALDFYTNSGGQTLTRQMRLRANGLVEPQTALKLPTYTVAGVPSASTLGAGTMIYVSNGAAGNPIVAFSDGTNWLRCDTATAIS